MIYFGCNSNCRMRDFSFRFAPLPMTSGQMRFLPAVEMTGVSREKGGGGEMAASPPSHHPSYYQCHGVISTAGRNLICPLGIGNEVRNLQNYENVASKSKKLKSISKTNSAHWKQIPRRSDDGSDADTK